MEQDYFTERDFEKCVPPCKKTDIHPETLIKLNRAREIAGFAFVPVSGFRTVEHEKKMGRPGTSAHTKGRAVDLLCLNSIARMRMVKALIDAGFKRIGVATTYIHADDDPEKILDVMWTY